MRRAWRRKWALTAVAAALAVGASLLAVPRTPEWTTSSTEALDAFRAAQEAKLKVYWVDAARHLERALEMDPDFVMAKLELARVLELGMIDLDRARALRDEVVRADVSGLTERERLLVERQRAATEGKSDEAERLLDQSLERHPDDLYLLGIKANLCFGRGRLDRSRELYERILEIAPNWVLAYNQLGYISMIQGRFAEAEEHFSSYRFIAPDQANPHDSLGDMLLVTGRLDEAAASFQQALQIRPDFCNSWELLAETRVLADDIPALEHVISEAERVDGCREVVAVLKREVEAVAKLRQRQWRQLLEGMDSDPPETPTPPSVLVMAHRAACELGDWENAEAIEEKLRTAYLRHELGGPAADESPPPAAWLHARGVRLAVQGMLVEAIAELEACDRRLDYRTADLALAKLFNRLVLVEVLRARDEDAAALRLLAEVDEVNSVVAERFERAGLEILGL